jgi:multidrug resistance efflux pump
VAAATATLARVRAGARAEEIEGARARVAAADAQIAILAHDRAETTIVAPSSGIVTSRLVEPGELVAVGTPVGIIIDLDHAWVNAYVEEPLVPSLRLQQPVTVVTDGGDRLEGRVAFIAPRAEFTPRNVQTPEERSKQVFRIKVTLVDGVDRLRPGMEADVWLEER